MIKRRMLIGLFFVAGFGLLVMVMLSHQAPAIAAPNLDGTPPPSPTPRAETDLISVSKANIPTYFQDVEPVIETSCMVCHSEGTIGYDKFAIDSYQDVVNNAEDVAYYVGVGYMPPWQPSDLSPRFKYNRSLSANAIATIEAWYEGGMPMGDINNRTIEQQPVERILPELREDLILQMPVAYTPNERLTDDYRCFLIDPEITEQQFVTGHNILPGETSLVHHVIIYQVPASAKYEVSIMERQDPNPGWQCFGGTNLSSGDLVNMIGAWVPGSVPTVHAEGAGIAIEPGNLIVLQVHYNTEAGIKPDQTSLVLELAQPDEAIRQMFTLPIFAPVELPCPAGMEDNIQCKRAWAVNDAASGMSNYLLGQCGASKNDFLEQDAANVTSTCDIIAPASGYVMSVAGHMHNLGKSTRLELNPGLADEQILLDIPDWDFHWQGSYQLEEPVHVTVGDALRLTCVWDNSENDRYVVWGERTSDEMCLNFILFLPD